MIYYLGVNMVNSFLKLFDLPTFSRPPQNYSGRENQKRKSRTTGTK
jgi:hypothetical protein